MAVLFKGPKKERRKPPEDPEDFRLTLVEHLEELRTRIFRSLIILGIAWIVSWQFTYVVYSALTSRMETVVLQVLPKGIPYEEDFFHAPDAFLLQVKLSFYAALIPAFPLILIQLWGFIEPALKPSEREPVKKVAPISLFLFALGAFFAWLVLPQAMGWFVTYVMNFPGVKAVRQEAGTLAFFSMKMMLAFGISFQLPLVVFILGSLGILKAESLFQYWRHAATIIFIVSMIITPSNDPMTMLMMAIPLVILFVISVYAVKYNEKRKKRAVIVGPDASDDLE